MKTLWYISESMVESKEENIWTLFFRSGILENQGFSDLLTGVSVLAGQNPGTGLNLSGPWYSES